MKKLIFTIAFFCLFVQAQPGSQTIAVTFQWDASADAPGPADNPVKYKLYLSETNPNGSVAGTPTDCGTNLTGVLQLQRGTSYVFATAYNYALSVDGTPNTDFLQESGPSNILRVEVTIPPGNPGNFKIKSAVVGETTNGQTVTMRQAD